MARPNPKPGDPIAELVDSLLVELGENPRRPGLRATPDRVARSLRELTDGYGLKPEDVIADAIFDHVHVGYLPNGKVVGLSKIPRLVEVFSHRLQIQEQLTNQVAQALNTALAPRGVGVVIQARHLCMEMRGVETPGGRMITSCMLGSFRRDPRTRSEFLDLVHQA
jgi:GTP cyclohydrolase IA